MLAQTTITAIATPPGRGGVGVIRLSGPKAFTIAEALTKKYFLNRVWRVFVSFTMRLVR